MQLRLWGLLIFLLSAGFSESAAQYRESRSETGKLGSRLVHQVEDRGMEPRYTRTRRASTRFTQSRTGPTRFAQNRLSPNRSAQTLTQTTPSAKKALLLSFLLPGLGHRYVNSGSWSGAASAFTAIDIGLWAALIGGEWRRDHLEGSYTTLAASRAGADVNGKDRFFFLNLATYRSSEEFLETVLRNRAWDQIDYVEDVSFQWNWSTESDFLRFRSLREDAESLRRRRVVIIASLVANRLISGLTAARRAGKREVQLSLGPPIGSGSAPSARVIVRY